MSRKQFQYTAIRRHDLDLMMRYPDLCLVHFTAVPAFSAQTCRYSDFTMCYPDFMDNARAFAPVFFDVSIYNILTDIKTLS